MASNPVHGMETWAVLVVSRDGQQILVRTEEENLSLPQIAIPAHERVAANLNRVLQQDLGMPVVSLYPILPTDSERSARFPYHAATVLSPKCDLPQGTAWKFIPDLSPHSFPCEEDFSAIHAFRTGLERKDTTREKEPFLKPDWFWAVTRWIEDARRSHGRRLTRPFEQFNADSIFSLIRFESNRAPVWFKAVGEANSREFPITLALAQLCPARLPKILASNPEWNAWLAEEASGVCLSARPDQRLWEDVAASLAHLQILSIPVTDVLRTAGARDLAGAPLRSLVERSEERRVGKEC